ncbi:MAG: group I truncated hemoglobin [Planctomycetota bacterium]
MKRMLLGLAVVALGGLVLATSAQDNATAKKALFERLGGIYSIASVVDDFVDRLYANETINGNAAVKAARDRTPKAGLKFQVTALVAELSGGPYKYHGRSMVESHKTLGINQKEWDAMAADFKKSLEKFKVPAPEQKELFDMVESSKKDIVVK